ncbi:MAG: multidrug ABC transporter ATP-binding protein [Oceanicaulis sp.]|jgi:ABC-2 type transport system ATP-binding protein|uniref:ABC transporter ATP-binding protein n=1 Tax=unclassified Oceanicaulis TaxID=2632123 RepID=UPI000C491065|nr:MULTISPECIES: ABC transporter ATP-binding protein [unclassified Oceanicaulis]MAB68423.1 multidrug ABC transporter ATP-binding protein [Oceanicaulis sp.]MBC37803.1 multidrug ABC transporter ATP-binding protein [Oceanicaulis sp.]MBG34284.1 multidrug ABC transporter ATP-binding protein [Oceanicaulis sp.]HCR93358.1 multidrug ABC transporter ATP-binding protein [Oceanicaulis sp.]|tara:strand:+ start:207 stop:1169 length:963 start_codon:yes stop_codon:yes gene_type:complete
MSHAQPEFALEAYGLKKTYPGGKGAPAKEALKGVDLQIPRGSIFGLLGPNGAGKSTFINIFAGLVTKSAGTAKIWGVDIDKDPRRARAAIGVVPQELNMDVFFTPYETLELMAGFYGVPKAERRTEEILAALGLEDKRNAYVRQLSGGMKRRLLVGKALVHNPPVLVLDEPTAGVDIELRRQLWDYVVELNKLGVTIVLTTHYLEEAQELCDQIAIVNHGEVVACEPKADLLKRMDKKTLVIEPVEPLKAVPAGFEQQEAVIRPDGSLAITYRFGEASVADMIETYRASGQRIADLRTEEPDLEDVFLALTYQADAKQSA